MNTYSDDGNFILDATGQGYPVETPHPIPLPQGIEQEAPENTEQASILFCGGGTTPSVWGDICYVGSKPDTHWLARRPLPEVPKVKTQEELDEEYIDSIRAQWIKGDATMRDMLRAAIAYARKGAK